MPRINEQFLASVLFLYPSHSDARQGSQLGGSGFFYGIPVENTPDQFEVFVVTCKHLISNEIYLRINTLDGSYKIVETVKNDWLTDQSEDIAIYPLPNDSELKIGLVKKDLDTINQDFTSRLNIGPGDDAFIVGRFLKHGGTYQNTPVVRFGNLAMMPFEPIYNEAIKLETPCYLVDLRIREGFSGSPVFIQYRDRFAKKDGQSSGPWSGEKLLGISWGGFKSKENRIEIYEDMACVIPVDKINSLIDQWTG